MPASLTESPGYWSDKNSFVADLCINDLFFLLFTPVYPQLFIQNAAFACRSYCKYVLGIQCLVFNESSNVVVGMYW